MTDKPTSEKLLTTREVAELLGVTAPTVISWVKKGHLCASLTPGGHRRVAMSEVVRFADVSGSVLLGNHTQGYRLASRDLRILILDGDAEFSEMVVEFLNLQPHMTGKSAIGAIDVGYQLGTFRPDVVLCGVDVPGVQVQAVIEIAMQAPKTRVYLLTSNQTQQDVLLSKDLQVEGVLEKPLKLDDLLALIRR